ncbi:uncharacterized protein LOC131859411 [Cryptomeria japonica]|uniref:uncharacterized protein LOC131859411 n=1 Tax=Cryptomeria japonica TaxID=3369 RepID=UPI0027D9FF7A|nr:uncharacterized protein LOC131859411 [Cryptomeria japonica]
MAGTGSASASSSSVANVRNENTPFKIDQDSPLWHYTTMIKPVSGGGGFVWRCNHCGIEYTSSYYRVKGHLCFIPGRGIKFCKGSDGKGLPKALVLGYIKEQEEADRRSSKAKTDHPLVHQSSMSKRPSSSMGSTRPASSHPFMQNPPVDAVENQNVVASRKRGPLDFAFKNELREIADSKIARCLYGNGLPFNLVRSPYFRDMVHTLCNTPSDYVCPGYEKVRTTLLAKEKASIELQLKVIKDTWQETGVTIVFDGWKDCKNRPLINVIAVCPKGAMFLKAVDCEGQVKDASFIANILIECIDMVGPQNVVQVVTDNAKNCRAAGTIVEATYGHIFWTPCAVHSLNLIMQKLGTQIDWVKKLYAEAEEIQMFVTNHHMSQAIFRTFSKLELLKVAETRFASHTLVLRRLLKVRDALSSMVINSLWSVWKQSHTERALKVRALILSEKWWDDVEYVLNFTEPIMSMIRYADTDRPCLGEIYDGMDCMVEKIKEVINRKENDPTETFFKVVQKIVVDRWNKMTTPLHLLAFALTPKFYSAEMLATPRRVPPYRDAEVASGYRVAFKKIYQDEETRNIVMREFGQFVSAKNHDVVALNARYGMDADEWWYVHGQGSIYLQPLAIKLNSQVASSSSAERNWSTYSFIHSVKRNRLGAKKAEDLVYVHSNLRLLSHKDPEYSEGVTRNWDLAPECADLDATVAQLCQVSIDEAVMEFERDIASGSGIPFDIGSIDAEFEPLDDRELGLDASDEDEYGI